MVLPEQWPQARQAVCEARHQRLATRRLQSLHRLGWGSVLLILLGSHQYWHAVQMADATLALLPRLLDALQLLIRSLPLGIALLLWFSLLLMPWYDAHKEWREWHRHDQDSDGLIPMLRFETWLTLQRVVLTPVLGGLMMVVWLLQCWLASDGLQAAGLIKTAYHAGEYWRLATAPWLHGNWLHIIFNTLALLYLGKRVELFARWPHLLLVLSISILVGGVASAHFLQADSVGMSGGLLGLLGFLLIFETLHHRLVPRSARRRLLAAVLLTAVMGLIGYRFIDNAAHLAGLLAGMAYGVIVFPPSASVDRPKILRVDRFAGGLAGLFLIASLLLVLMRLVS